MLNKKLSTLNLQPVQGWESSPMSSKVSGQTYQVDANDLKIQTITLSFGEALSTIKFQTATGEEAISYGYGTWQWWRQTTLFNDARWFSDAPTAVVASGAWITDDTFTMMVRLYETPFFHRLIFCFAGSELIVEIQVNVSLDFSKPLLLTAHV